MNLKIIGTSHIAAQSIAEIRKTIEEEKPDIIAVELDPPRTAALLHEEKSKLSLRELTSIGLRGYLFAKIGQYIQQKLGKMVGVSPGSEMKTALELAHKNNLKIALIDQPIKITLRNFSKTLTWKEKARFAGDFLSGMFFPKRQLQKLGMDKFDLRKVPEKDFITKIMKEMKQRYPSVYKTLVEDRNRYMVRKLVVLMKQNPDTKILAIVGAGHKPGMEELLLKIDIV